MNNTATLEVLGIDQEPNIENLVEYISPIDDGDEAKPAAFLFGATGFTVEQSFGRKLIDDLEAKGYTVVCIPGPAAILPNEKKGLVKLPVKLHGYTSFNPYNWLKAYYKGTGEGGVEKNVAISSTILKALSAKGKLDTKKKLLVEGWSRGGTAAQRFTHTIPKELTSNANDEDNIKINLRLNDPVMGGIHDDIHESDINTRIPDHVKQAHLMYAASDQLPIFEPHYFSDNSKLGKRFLPTTHDGMALPFYREETKNVVELNELYRAEDFQLGDGENGQLSTEQNARKNELEAEMQEKLKTFLLKQATTLHQLRKALENGSGLNKKRAEHKLDELGCIGRLPLYQEAAKHLYNNTTLDHNDYESLQQLADDSEFLWNKIKTENRFKKVISPAFLSALAKYSTPEMTKTVGGKLKHLIQSKFSKNKEKTTEHITVPPPSSVSTGYILSADTDAKRDDFHNALDAMHKNGQIDHVNTVKNGTVERCNNLGALTHDTNEYQIAPNKNDVELVKYDFSEKEYEVTKGSSELFAIVAELAERTGQKTIRIDELPKDHDIRSYAWIELKLKGIETIPPEAPLGKPDEERLETERKTRSTTPTLVMADPTQ